MNFVMDEEQKKVRKVVIDYIRENINPLLNYKCFSKEIWHLCACGGLLAYNLSEEYGKMNFSLRTQMIITESIGYACKDSGLVFAINNHLWACQSIIEKFGSKGAKTKYLNKMADGQLIGAYAITEEAAGSDNSNIKTIYEEKDDYYLLNGSKVFISNAPVADVFVIVARNVENKGISRYSAFIVEKNFHGVSISKEIDKMGLQSCPMSEITLKNCKVPKGNILGGKNSGVFVINKAMELERFFEFVSHIGSMKRMLHKCIEYVKLRKQSGQKIGEFQSISKKIARMRTNIEIGMTMAENIVEDMMKNRHCYMKISMFKLLISEKYVDVCRDAMQIHGAYGYTKEYGIERELRDALASTIYAGTNEIQENIIFQMSKFERFD